MHLRVKIYTTSKGSWVEDRIPWIKKQLEKARNLTTSIEVKKIILDELPIIFDKEYQVPDWKWLKQNIFEPGYDIVGLHLNSVDKEKFGLDDRLGGYYHYELDDILDFYIVANEKTKASGYDFDGFSRIMIHEICHGFDSWKYAKPNVNVHHWDYELKKIHELPATYDFNYMPILNTINLIKSALVRIIQLLMNKETNSIHIEALKWLGKDASPLDVAPDELGCAESVSNIIRQVIDFPLITGTWTLMEKLNNDPHFILVDIDDIKKGDVLLYATGEVAEAPFVGHVFISDGAELMSNTSTTGNWEKNYTLAKAREHWEGVGYKPHVYRLNK